VWRIEAYSPTVFYPLNGIHQSAVDHLQAKFQQVVSHLIPLVSIFNEVSDNETHQPTAFLSPK
jgi:hypothetical protein